MPTEFAHPGLLREQKGYVMGENVGKEAIRVVSILASRSEGLIELRDKKDVFALIPLIPGTVIASDISVLNGSPPNFNIFANAVRVGLVRSPTYEDNVYRVKKDIKKKALGALKEQIEKEDKNGVQTTRNGIASFVRAFSKEYTGQLKNFDTLQLAPETNRDERKGLILGKLIELQMMRDMLLGKGKIAHYHSPDESILLNDYSMGRDIFLRTKQTSEAEKERLKCIYGMSGEGDGDFYKRLKIARRRLNHNVYFLEILNSEQQPLCLDDSLRQEIRTFREYLIEKREPLFIGSFEGMPEGDDRDWTVLQSLLLENSFYMMHGQSSLYDQKVYGGNFQKLLQRLMGFTSLDTYPLGN